MTNPKKKTGEKTKRSKAPANNEYPTDGNVTFVTEFKHWRSGKIIKASEYGLKCFPIGRKK